MKNEFSVTFRSRDFEKPILTSTSSVGYPIINQERIKPENMSWSIYGGPEEAELRVDTDIKTLIKLSGLIRCPVEIQDQQKEAIWWGYVHEIELNFEGAAYKISIDDLWNKVKVVYSFISPDNKQADQYETAWHESEASKIEYGTKEIIIKKRNFDDDFAEKFAENFLEKHKITKSELKKKEKEKSYATIKCKGWFSTLDWISYNNSDGFFANYGPGPGTQVGGQPAYRDVCQSFTTGGACNLKYAWFLVKKYGLPTNNITARLWSNSGGSPNSVIATSSIINGATLSDSKYKWICFTFSSSYTLNADTRYWISFRASSSSGTNYYILRTDETASFIQEGEVAKRYDSTNWNLLVNTTSPKTNPQLHFRIVCISDTGKQIKDITTEGNQFINVIFSLTTNTKISQYRNGKLSCMEEIKKLMELGTGNQRQIIAKMDKYRNVFFSEQPSNMIPEAFLNSDGRMIDKKDKEIKPYKPPIGKWIGLGNQDYFIAPFDSLRYPLAFVKSAKYNCKTGKLTINA